MKCRIMSVFVIALSLIVTVISIIVIANKSNKQIIYADDIKFVSVSSSFEMLRDNYIIIDESLVNITPANCNASTEFSITKPGADEEEVISAGKYKFTNTGRHILKCKVKAGDNYYKHDKMFITVVDEVSENAGMYIKALDRKTLYVDDCINIEEVFKMSYPTNTAVSIKHSQHITISNDVITAVNDGIATIDVALRFDNITITDTISIVVRPKIVESEIGLKLSIANQVLENNIVEVAISKYNFAISYELTNTDFQLINCYTDSSLLEIVSYDAPVIVIKAKEIGEARIYISPLDYPDRVFEVIIKIVE